MNKETIEALLATHESMDKKFKTLLGSVDTKDQERAWNMKADLEASQRHHYGMATGDSVSPDAIIKCTALGVILAGDG